MTDEATIDVEGVRKTFGTTVALAGVDLYADAARVLASSAPGVFHDPRGTAPRLLASGVPRLRWAMAKQAAR
jgi:hypothetical protein